MLLLAIWIGLPHESAAAEKNESLDQQLFESLDDDLFSDLVPLDAEPPSESEPPVRELDVELQRDLGGDDVSQARGSTVLERLAKAMQRVSKKLVANNTSVETQAIQEGIVKDIDKLLALLQKQSPKKSGGSARNSKPQAGESASNSLTLQQIQSNTNSSQPASQSSSRLGQVESVAMTQQQRDQLMEKVWGNLPAAVRQQMQSSRPETFLPKYAKLIEDYFRRLAEDPPE